MFLSLFREQRLQHLRESRIKQEKSFVDGTFPLHFAIYVSKKFSVSTEPRVWTGKVATLLFVTIRQLST